MWVVYKVEFGGDIDGTGLEQWLSEELGRFDTKEAADDFLNYCDETCEIVYED